MQVEVTITHEYIVVFAQSSFEIVLHKIHLKHAQGLYASGCSIIIFKKLESELKLLHVLIKKTHF